MDGKYSKYIPSSYGFITKLEIVDNVLHVYTNKTIKREPHRYPLGEKFTKYAKRLERQYELITEEENLQVIKNDLINDSRKGLNTGLLVLSGPVLLTCGFTAIILSAIAPIILGLIIEAVLLIIHQISLKKVELDFDEEMDMIKTYLEHRQDIEAMSQKDLNVTSNLNTDTLNRINTNQELHTNHLIPEIYDITLLDDLISQQKSKSELKKLLTNYKICVALEEPQVFVNPNEPQVTIPEEYEEQEENVESTDIHTKSLKPSKK